jgi:hypothetical protein
MPDISLVEAVTQALALEASTKKPSPYSALEKWAPMHLSMAKRRFLQP